MKMSGLLSRRGHDLPGVVGTARLLAPGADAPRRLSSRDIVVADLNRMTAATARSLVDTDVAAVVHTPVAGEDMLPRAAYRILAASTIPVVEDVVEPDGTDEPIPAGARIRIDGGVVYKGDAELTTGRRVEAGQMLSEVDGAEDALVDAALSHMANSVEFLRLEHSLVFDGDGVPEVDVDMDDRHVVVVTGGDASARQLHDLKPFLREYRPVLVGVGEGADLLRKARLDVDLVVANPEAVSDEALDDAAAVVVPADRDGHADGLDRIGALGISATTFPAAATARDMAVLIAHHGGASMIVVTGEETGLVDAYRPEASPSATIVDRAVAAKLVHADACATLYRSRGTGVGLALVVLAALVAVAAVVVARGAAQDVLDWAIHTWNTFALWVQGLIK